MGLFSVVLENIDTKKCYFLGITVYYAFCILDFLLLQFFIGNKLQIVIQDSMALLATARG